MRASHMMAALAEMFHSVSLTPLDECDCAACVEPMAAPRDVQAWRYRGHRPTSAAWLRACSNRNACTMARRKHRVISTPLSTRTRTFNMMSRCSADALASRLLPPSCALCSAAVHSCWLPAAAQRSCTKLCRQRQGWCSCALLCQSCWRRQSTPAPQCSCQLAQSCGAAKVCTAVQTGAK